MKKTTETQNPPDLNDRKPTLERGSQDGGLRFAVEDSVFEEDVDLPAGPTLTMRRISEGQEIRKVNFGVEFRLEVERLEG